MALNVRIVSLDMNRFELMYLIMTQPALEATGQSIVLLGPDSQFVRTAPPTEIGLDRVHLGVFFETQLADN